MRKKRDLGKEGGRLGVGLVALIVISFTLLFWLTVLWTIPGLSLLEISRFWSVSGYAGFSLFAACTFIVLLLLYLLVAEGVIARQSADNWTVGLCLLLALPLAAVGATLVEIAHLPTYFLLEPYDRIDEPFDTRSEYLGRIVETTEVGTTRYLQVALEDGTRVTVSAVPTLESPDESDHVVVRRFAGRLTHTLCHRLSSYLPGGWLGLATERRLNALE